MLHPERPSELGDGQVELAFVAFEREDVVTVAGGGRGGDDLLRQTLDLPQILVLARLTPEEMLQDQIVAFFLAQPNRRHDRLERDDDPLELFSLQRPRSEKQLGAVAREDRLEPDTGLPVEPDTRSSPVGLGPLHKLFETGHFLLDFEVREGFPSQRLHPLHASRPELHEIEARSVPTAAAQIHIRARVRYDHHRLRLPAVSQPYGLKHREVDPRRGLRKRDVDG